MWAEAICIESASGHEWITSKKGAPNETQVNFINIECHAREASLPKPFNKYI